MLFRGLILVLFLTLISSTRAEVYTSGPTILLEPIRVEYFDKDSGEAIEKTYRVSLDFIGDFGSNYDVERGDVEVFGEYQVQLELEDEDIEVEKIHFSFGTQSSPNNNFGISMLNVVYQQANNLLRKKYEDRSKAVTNISLVGAYYDGKTELFDINGLNLVYGGQIELGSSLNSAKGYGGLTYKKFELIGEGSYSDFSKSENPYIEESKRWELNYKLNKKLSFGLYHKGEKVEVFENNWEATGPMDTLNGVEKGFHLEYQF